MGKEEKDKNKKKISNVMQMIRCEEEEGLIKKKKIMDNN